VPAVPTATGPAVAPAVAPDTRSRILDIALELFSEHGFDGTTLQQIADRLGFTKAALYYHFRSKEDLLQALLTPAMTGLEELLDAHESEADTPGERRRFLEDYLDYLLGHRRLIAYMSSDLAILAHPIFATGSAERRARLERRLAGDGLEFTDQVRVAMAFRGIGGAIAQYPDADTAQLRAALLDAVRALMRGPRRRDPRTVASAKGSSSV
jgi:AcrR family transcriptional regulator